MPPTPESLLRLDAVRSRTGLGRSSLYALIQRGEFPAPIHIKGTRISAWSESAVSKWVNDQLNTVAA